MSALAMHTHNGRNYEITKRDGAIVEIRVVTKAEINGATVTKRIDLDSRIGKAVMAEMR